VSSPRLIVPTNLQMETVGLAMVSQRGCEATDRIDKRLELELELGGRCGGKAAIVRMERRVHGLRLNT
jgi:hypothetical protein